MAGLQHVSLPYPTTDQGTDAVLHLGKFALKLETPAKNELAAQAWIALGVGLSKVLPMDATGQPMEAAKLPSHVRDALEKAHAELQTGKIDWTALLKTLLPWILSLLGLCIMVLCLVCTPVAVGGEPCHCLVTGECTCVPGTCRCGDELAVAQVEKAPPQAPRPPQALTPPSATAACAECQPAVTLPVRTVQPERRLFQRRQGGQRIFRRGGRRGGC